MTTMSPQLTSLAYAPEARTGNRLAIMSVAAGILQFFLLFVPCWLVTIPLALNAVHQTEDHRDGGSRHLAIAGLSLAVTHFAVYVGMVIWLIAGN
ncbi:hypothetical protein [Mycobacterium bourgelatii]|uniref:DUF4190 domain-containing protein n=1 Tax=Mycobacterium bourgelatii TaxID=1273442 RepID=A0A7I9YP54_MYCBU|nr:hypothetical protein [Mycobacterium bourgelatii]MCV6975987.1 hypothetical protein [Mycobacterium bourgelatii]GFG90283.1 hypothetical protein MBOU_23250 [Mycobacterium bourgelatii]